MGFDRGSVVMVQHIALGAQCRALDVLARRTRKVEEQGARAVAGRQRNRSRTLELELAKAVCICFATGPASDESRHELFVFARHRTRNLRHRRRDLAVLGPQPAGGKVRCDVGPAVRPSTAKRHVHPEPELSRRPRGKSNVVEKFRREIREVADAARRIVGRHGVDRRNFESADATILHAAHFRRNLLAGDRRPEPPPAHHDAAVCGRIAKRLFELRAVAGLLGPRQARRQGDNRQQHSGDGERAAAARHRSRGSAARSIWNTSDRSRAIGLSSAFEGIRSRI